MKNITLIKFMSLVLSLILTLGGISVYASEVPSGAIGTNASLDLDRKSVV